MRRFQESAKREKKRKGKRKKDRREERTRERKGERDQGAEDLESALHADSRVGALAMSSHFVCACVEDSMKPSFLKRT